MLNIREYVKVQSLEEAYELNQKRTNKVIGGMLWMKMGSRNIQKAIDLSGLGLDKIEETEEEFRIGCMTTLRDLELHPGLEAYTGGAMKESLRHIVTKRYIEALKAQAGHAAQVISYLEFLADTNPDKLCEMIKSGEWKKRFGVKSAQQLPKEPGYHNV